MAQPEPQAVVLAQLTDLFNNVANGQLVTKADLAPLATQAQLADVQAQLFIDCHHRPGLVAQSRVRIVNDFAGHGASLEAFRNFFPYYSMRGRN